MIGGNGSNTGSGSGNSGSSNNGYSVNGNTITITLSHSNFSSLNSNGWMNFTAQNMLLLKLILLLTGLSQLMSSPG